MGAVNIQPNAVKLESCFEKVGIQLTDEEKFCISCRNSFLHGGVPKNKDLEFLSQEDMVFMVSQRLIMLSAMLILKLAGYRGKVIDWGYTIIVKRRAIMSGSPVWKPMHKQPCYKGVPAYVNGVSEALFKVGMCLPSGPYVSDDDVRYIVETIKNAIVK